MHQKLLGKNNHALDTESVQYTTSTRSKTAHKQRTEHNTGTSTGTN